MSSSWVLKLARSDDDGFLLLQVSSTGNSALDLNLLATEGEAPYKGKIRQRKITELRAKNFYGSDEEWQNILRHIFDPQCAVSLPEDLRKSLETVATISKGKAVITIRNRIDKITQRLGSIEISRDDDAEIQLFDWCRSVIDQKRTLEAEKADLRNKYDSTQATVASLEAKLEELVKAKAENEEAMISKFVLLLNEKKLKIRNQQRLLSTAQINQKKLKQMERTQDGKGWQAEGSRSGKRRAKEPAEEAEDLDESSDDAFEKMDIDKQQQEGIVAPSQEASSERQTTPETETASETESDVELEPTASRSSHHPQPPAPRTNNAGKAPKQKAGSPPGDKPRQTETRRKSPSPPPPVRQLPFAKKSTDKTNKGSKTAAVAEPAKLPPAPVLPANESGEETASDDDDEL